MAKIYVQIAAYRDPELPFTVADLLAKARYPKSIRVGVCNQATPAAWDHEVLQDRRVAQVKVPYREAQGTCWARHRVQELYQGEEFTLQLDSHHRFVEGWDQIALDMLQQTGSSKPVLTAYLPGYKGKGKRTKPAHLTPAKQVFQQFDPEGVVAFQACPLAPDERVRPPRARFTSGHFIFAPGKFIEEVPYDPTLYFMGEEITLAARAFTHGYDLFHPHRLAVWHSYVRAGSRRHWDDHNEKEDERLTPWHRYQRASVKRVQDLLVDGVAVLAPYGLGAARTLREYELYAGLNFKHRLAHPNTLEGLEPPSTRCWNWEWTHRPGRELEAEVKLDARELAKHAASDFWYFGLHDETGLELFRTDLRDPDYLTRKNRRLPVRCWSRGTPTTYTVVPYYRESGWGKRIRRPLTPANYQVIFAS